MVAATCAVLKAHGGRDERAIALIVVALGDLEPMVRTEAATAIGAIPLKVEVEKLLVTLADPVEDVRRAGAIALGRLGDRRAIQPLERLLDIGLKTYSSSTSIVVEQSDSSEPYDSILEALGTLQAKESTAKVQAFLDHPTPRIQYAAARSMYQLTGENQYGDRLISALNGPDLQLRRAALMDVGAIGYLPAAETIANTLAENSLKLISMKGLLEFQVTHNPEGALSPGAVRVMDLMDGML